MIKRWKYQKIIKATMMILSRYTQTIKISKYQTIEISKYQKIIKATVMILFRYTYTSDERFRAIHKVFSTSHKFLLPWRFFLQISFLSLFSIFNLSFPQGVIWGLPASNSASQGNRDGIDGMIWWFFNFILTFF